MTPDLFTIRAPRTAPPPRAAAPNWKPEGCADCYQQAKEASRG